VLVKVKHAVIGVYMVSRYGLG